MSNGTYRKRQPLPPLKITCTSAECESGLHCFKPDRRMKAQKEFGKCRYCGAQLFDWNRLYKRDSTDTAYVFRCLKYEMFRHHMWHVELDQKAINYARRKGWNGLRSTTEKRIRKYIGPAKLPYDGRQTPREGAGNPICYAQHATASCCRKCIEYWHGIRPGQELTDEEVLYFTELIMLYIQDRLPSLTDNGEKIPPMRRVN